MKYALILISVLWLMVAGTAEATCSTQTVNVTGDEITYTGSCTDDNEDLITTGIMLKYDACTIMSTVGLVDVFVSLDGTNYSTAGLSLVDGGATDTNPVLVTAALRVYYFPIKARNIKVKQNTATDAAATMICWVY